VTNSVLLLKNLGALTRLKYVELVWLSKKEFEDARSGMKMQKKSHVQERAINYVNTPEVIRR